VSYVATYSVLSLVRLFIGELCCNLFCTFIG